jgi:integrase
MLKITDDFVAKLEPPAKGNKVYWDSGHKKAVTGFGARITATGAKAFVFNYRTSAGRLRRITIGKYPAYTATLAREIAKKHRHTIDNGGDPLAARQGERDAPTVADLAQLYLDTHAKSKRPVPAKTDRYTIEKEILPAMKHLKVADVKFGDVAKLHRRITDRAPYRANRVLALLSTMFGIATKQGWRADNPTRGVQRNLETPRERYLSGDELIRLSDALTAHPDQTAANAVRLLLLTGARRGEVLSMAWDQIDFDKGTWTKPSSHTKTKKTHHVPLSAPALQLLAEMRDGSSSSYVFPGRDGTGHRVDLKRPWPEICKAAGIERLRLHDLRHSFASVAAAGGASLPIIGKLLGHTQPGTTARYAHLDVDPLREVAERVGAIIGGAGKAGAEVVKLRR